MPFELVNPRNSEPILFKTKSFADDRGYFFESYKHKDLNHLGLTDQFVQDNVSYSVKDVLRGMHYQLNPMAQSKLVQCLRGEIYDVMVDVRKGSPTYGKIYYTISEKNGYVLYVPEGYAHGFIVRSNDALVTYKTNKEWSPAHESGFMWNDPELNINWGVVNPIVSEKDRKMSTFRDAENNFSYKASDSN
jgi:dTDP-4-dehydrorhamnose 3,5-epimerase